MSLFKPLKGDSSRISLDVTPFHDGWAYFTPDNGGFYIDCEVDGEQRRVRVKSPGSGAAQATLSTARCVPTHGRTASRGLASMGLLQIRMVSSASLTTSQTNSCWPAGMVDCTSANRAKGI